LSKQKTNLVRTSKILDSVCKRAHQKYEAFCEIDKEWGLEDNMTYNLEGVLDAFVRAKTNVGKNGQRILKPEPMTFTFDESHDILT
jgi:hypothetical protein